MKGVYSESKELISLIESHGLLLYDSLQTPGAQPLKWSQMELMGPAREFEVGNSYIFAPKPKQNQSLRDAYAITKGLGPSLRIEDPAHERWVHLEVRYKTIGTVALFTRLLFEKEFVAASTPHLNGYPEPDLVAIQYDLLLDTFKKYFFITTPEQLGLTTPVPLRSDIANN